MKSIALFFAAAALLSGCKMTNTIGGNLSPGGQPKLVHAFNGSKLGFYTTTGGYGLGSQTTSILNLGSIGTSQQMPLDSQTGRFFLGTASCTGCNDLIYFDSYNGFRFSNLAASEFSLLAGGNTMGAAINHLMGYVYTADSVNNRIYFMNENSLGHPSSYSNAIIMTGSSSVSYLASDDLLGKVVIVDKGNGDAFVMDGSDGAQMTTSPGALSFVGAGTCTSAASLGHVIVNASTHLAYVLCAGDVVFLNLNVTNPTYAFSSLAASTMTLANITAGKEIALNTQNRSIIVSGGQFVSSIDAATGAARSTMDLTTGDCGFSTMDLEGLAYDSVTNTLFVADAQNSKIYLLDAGTLDFKNGACSLSNFSTATDVPSPVRITYY